MFNEYIEVDEERCDEFIEVDDDCENNNTPKQPKMTKFTGLFLFFFYK